MIIPNNNTEYELLLKQVCHVYCSSVQEKHHYNDHEPKDIKNNKRKRDDDGEGNQRKKNFEKIDLFIYLFIIQHAVRRLWPVRYKQIALNKNNK
jgi:hypothetical protein